MRAKLLVAPIQGGPSHTFLKIGWEEDDRCFYIAIHRLVIALFFDKKVFTPHLKVYKCDKC